MTTRSRFTALLGCLLLIRPTVAALPPADPAEVGLDAAGLARIDDVVDRSIASKQFPGAVVIVGRDGRIALAKAYGHRALVPAAEPMMRDTIFDMASLTKPMATATAAMILLERGKIRLGDSIVRHLPEFAPNGKRAITVEMLLRHRAGLIPDNPLRDYADGPAKAWERLANIGLQYPPGEGFRYSDVGFQVLGRLVERVSGEPLDRFTRTNIYEPLGMVDSGFLPPSDKLGRIAPTERDGGKMLRGDVHDPRSRAIGGVAGHAGLFSTADDVAVYAQMLLDGGQSRDGRSVLGPLTIRAMIDPADTPKDEERGLGWDVV
ncbi:MAG TPA: serine hydrolase domain-containing protein, partial [Isosphaeraceae bacterium]